MGKIKCKFDNKLCLTPCPNGQNPMVGSVSCRACKFFYSIGKDFVICKLTHHSLKTICDLFLEYIKDANIHGIVDESYYKQRINELRSATKNVS